MWVGALGSCSCFLPLVLTSVRSIERMPEPGAALAD
jgi:hypothetical protein